jgi:hypothetical protein
LLRRTDDVLTPRLSSASVVANSTSSDGNDAESGAANSNAADGTSSDCQQAYRRAADTDDAYRSTPQRNEANGCATDCNDAARRSTDGQPTACGVADGDYPPSPPKYVPAKQVRSESDLIKRQATKDVVRAPS